MQAIILAAGMGKRLGEYTKNNTKCMVKVNGESLISRLLKQLENIGNLNRIVIVVGYKGDYLMRYIKASDITIPIEFIENKDYEKTNNIYSLYLAKERLCEDDTLLFESDLIFEDNVLELLVSDVHKNIALVNKFQHWMSGTCVELYSDNKIKRFISSNKFNIAESENYYKTVNIYKFSKEFSQNYYIPFLVAYCHAMGKNEYYEQVLRVISMIDSSPLYALPLDSELWYEIDDANDLSIASILFASTEEKLKKLPEFGLWRFPQFLDFYYKGSSFFPPKSMIDELNAMFNSLIQHVPSQINISSLLAGMDFDVSPESIVAANDLKSLIIEICGENEYKSMCTCQYIDDDFINFILHGNFTAILISNPNIITGQLNNNAFFLKLLNVAKEKDIKVILNETDLEFYSSDSCKYSYLKQDLIDEYKNLIVVKDLAKTYGLNGIGIAIAASGNKGLIKSISNKIPLLNSISEYFLQIYLKYKNDFSDAVNNLISEREKMIKALSGLKKVDVIYNCSQFIKITLKNISAHELAVKLLEDYKILVREMDDSISIQVSVKTEKSNIFLINALKTLLN